MKINTRLLLIAALFALALPFLFVGNASAVYLTDGATQHVTTGPSDPNQGGWDLPNDMGACVSYIDSTGGMHVDSSITNRRDCLAKLYPQATQSACASTANTVGDDTTGTAGGATTGAHIWTSMCQAKNTTQGVAVGVSLKDLDLNSTMCTQKVAALVANGTLTGAGTWTASYGSACTGNWQYPGRDATFSNGAYVSGGFDQGFCYAAVDVTATYGTLAACIGANSATTPMLNSWNSTLNACVYSYGVGGGLNGKISSNAWSAVKNMANGTTTGIHATLPADMTVYNNMGKCLLAGFTWNNYAISGGTDSTIFSASSATVATNVVAGNWDCLRCHSSVAQYNSVAERWKESYLLQGHKNMLRKVTAGQQWGGPDANGNMTLYTGSAYSDGTLNWTAATAGSSNLPLLYIFGDWMAPAPAGLDVIVNTGGYARYNGTSAYSCSACHSTGFSNQTPAYCNGNLAKTTKSDCDTWKYPSGMTSSQRSVWTEAGLCTLSSYVNSSDCATAGATWVPMTGYQNTGIQTLEPTGGAEPNATYPGLNWAGNTTSQFAPAWDQNGIQCSRCHMVTFPEVYDATYAGKSGNGHDFGPAITTGAAITDMCFSCHQSTQKTTLGTGLDVDLNNPTSPGVSVTATTADFSGHPIGEEFLNSPHQRYAGTMAPNALGKYEIGSFTGGAFVPSGTFNTSFNDGSCSQSTYVGDGAYVAADGTTSVNGQTYEVVTSADCTKAGGTWGYRTDQGSCTTCHDVHNSMFVASETEKSMKKECEDCHTLTSRFGSATANKTVPPTVTISSMSHPGANGSNTANTPFDNTRFGSACETCHMPKASASGFPLHLWRINAASTYTTFPTYAQFSGNTQKTANTTVDDKGYNNAIWVDLGLACGQCHYSTGANYTSGNPVFTQAQLSDAAATLHGGSIDASKCLDCHNVAQGSYRAVQQGVNHHSGACSECHGTSTWPLHQGAMPGGVTPNYTLISKSGKVAIDTSIQTFCLVCHSSAKTRSSDGTNLPAIVQSGAGDNHHQGHAYIPGANGTDPGLYCLGCHGSASVVSPTVGSTYSITSSGLTPATVSVQKGLLPNANNTPGISAVSVLCVQCHSNVDSGHGYIAQVTANGVTQNHHAGDCLNCHVPDLPGGPGITSDASGNPQTPSTIPSWVDCSACHGNPAHAGTITITQSGASRNHHAGACVECHSAPGVPAMPAITDSDASVLSGCLSCHSNPQTRSADGTTLAAITPKVPTYGPTDNHHRGHGGNTADPVGYRCLGCHGQTTLDGSLKILASGLPADVTSTLKGFTGGADVTSSLCLQCHAQVQTGGIAGGQTHHAGACLTCHIPDYPGGPGITGGTGQTVTPQTLPNWGNCSACHDVTQATLGTTGTSTADSDSGAPSGTPALYRTLNGPDASHHAVTNMTSCNQCHTVTGVLPATTDCATCHATTQGSNPAIVPGTNHHGQHVTCSTCHPTGGAMATNAGVTYTSGPAGNAFCLTCHGNTGTHAHHHVVAAIAAAGKACSDCHAQGGVTPAPATNSDCLQCHNQSWTMTDGVTNLPAVNQGTDHHNGTCTTCHSEGGAYLAIAANGTMATANSNCLTCHTNPETSVTMGTLGGINPGTNHHGVYATCTECHGTVGGVSASNGGKTYTTDGNDFCLTCHSNTGSRSHHHVVPALKAAGSNCTDCHSPYGGILPAGITSSNTAPNSACLACHSQAWTMTDGVTNLPAVNQGTDHHNGTCTTCHTEGGSYLHIAANGTTATANSNCLTCHSTAQAIENSGGDSTIAINPTIGDPGKNHHGGAAAFGEAIANCTYCHNSFGGVNASVNGNSYPSNDLCLQCHSNSGSYAKHHAVAEVATAGFGCTDCHVVDGSGIVPPPGVNVPSADATNDNCLLCHSSDMGTSTAAGVSPAIDVAAIQPDVNHHGLSQTGVSQNCTVCHSEAMTPLPSTSTATCTGCHTDKSMSLIAVPMPDNSLGLGLHNCTDCHQPGVAVDVMSLDSVDATCGHCHGAAGPGPNETTAWLQSHIPATGMHSTPLPTAAFGTTVTGTHHNGITATSASKDAMGNACTNTTCSYSWTITGNTFSPNNASTASITGLANNSYTVALTVTDTAFGTSSTVSHTVNIARTNTAPTVSATATQGTAWDVTLHLTTADADGDTVTVSSVNWGDGTTNTSMTHTYSTLGTKTIYVTVTDGTANASTSASISLGQYSISGNAGEGGVSVALSNGPTTGSVTSGSDGSYSIMVNPGTYTLTPSKTGKTFTPASITGVTVGPNSSGNNFGAVTYALTVAKQLAGVSTTSGSVISSPVGISCGTACSASFNAAQSVVLTSTAPTGKNTTWTGCTSGGGTNLTAGVTTCSVTMSAAKSVTVNYTTPAAPALTVTKTANFGSVIGGNLTCGNALSTCGPVNEVLNGTYTLTATPATGHSLNTTTPSANWTGACVSYPAYNKCTVKMDQSKTIQVNFQ